MDSHLSVLFGSGLFAEKEKINNQKIKIMDAIAQKLWYQTLDWSMIWVCFFSIVALLLYMEVYGSKDVIKGKTGETIRSKWIKPLYHLVTGFVMLAIVVEIGYDSLKSFIGFDLETEAESKLLHTLAMISGVAGGYVIAKIIRLAQKLK